MISRRLFAQGGVAGAAATSLGACSSATVPTPDLRAGAGRNTSLGQLKQMDAGVLTVAYAEFGPAGGKPVVLLHGWPCDGYSYADVGALLAASGHRVIVPFLRGYGKTAFLSTQTVRNGQQTAIAKDVVDLMDALKIDKAVLGGFDWGSRTVGVIASLWPERC